MPAKRRFSPPEILSGYLFNKERFPDKLLKVESRPRGLDEMVELGSLGGPPHGPTVFTAIEDKPQLQGKQRKR